MVQYTKSSVVRAVLRFESSHFAKERVQASRLHIVLTENRELAVFRNSRFDSTWFKTNTLRSLFCNYTHVLQLKNKLLYV